MLEKTRTLSNVVTRDPFRAGLVLVLLALFLAVSFWDRPAPQPMADTVAPQKATIHVFYSPECPHCRKELVFLEFLTGQYPDLTVVAHDITVEQELNLMMLYARYHKVSPYELGTPFLAIGNHTLIGFSDAETSGSVIEQWVRDALSGEPAETAETERTETKEKREERVLHLPVFGTIDVFAVSLPALAIVLGLVDGFNPCAMWVLVYLISLIIGLNDRSKIYTLVGSFLMASGVLYFLFMTAWLNVFLVIGYVRSLTVLIGLAALYMGTMSIRDFIASGGQLICKVGEIDSRQRTRTRIQGLVASPLTWTSFAGIVALAFAVNSIEFVCSSALPAILTHVLSIADIPLLSYYAYILLYVLFFMLDDFIIFMSAALAADRFAGERYAGLCKSLGGLLMVGLGITLTFFPQALR